MEKDFLKQKIQKFIILANKTPLNFCLKSLYDGVLQILVSRLKQIEPIKYIGLTGSMAFAKPLYGASDIDLVFVLDGTEDEIKVAKRRIVHKLTAFHKLFPFVETLEMPKREQKGNYFSILVKGEENIPPILLKPLFSKDGYVYPSIETIEKSSFLFSMALNLSVILKSIEKNKFSYYRLKTKLRNLMLLAFNNASAFSDLKEIINNSQKSDNNIKSQALDILQILKKTSIVELYFKNIKNTEYEPISLILDTLIGFIIEKYSLNHFGNSLVFETKNLTDNQYYFDIDKYSKINLNSSGLLKWLYATRFLPWTKETNKAQFEYYKNIAKTNILETDIILNDFYLIYLLKNNITDFSLSIVDCFENLSKDFPENKQLFDYLKEYSKYFTANDITENAQKFPPNLIPTAVEFFLNYLFDIQNENIIEKLNKRLTISLCVCTKNRCDDLKELLETVVTQTRMPEEVLIVDNESTDNTKNIAMSFADRLPIKYCVENAKHIGIIRNRAIEESNYEIIAYTDDDCLLHKNWVYFVESSFLADESIGVVGGVVSHITDGSKTMLNLFNKEYLGVRF